MKWWSLSFLVAVLLSSSTANAAGENVIVAGPPKDPIVERVRRELVSSGFVPVGDDDAQRCNRTALANRAEANSAIAAVCALNHSVLVWGVDRHRLELRDVMERGAETPDDDVAVQAAEVVRAAVAYGPRVDLPAPVDVAKTPAHVEAAPVASPDADRTTSTFTNHPRLAFGGGPSVFMNGPMTPAVNMELDARLSQLWSLTARLDIATESKKVGYSHERSPGIIGAALMILPLSWTRSHIVPRSGIGVGVNWLSITSTTGNGASESTRDYLPMAFTQTGCQFFVGGPFRMSVDTLLGVTSREVRFQNSGYTMSSWGPLVMAMSFRAEVFWR